MVAGYAIGGGHVLHVVCDLTIAADNAQLRADRTDGRLVRRRLRLGLLARSVGQKKAREIWFLCRQYDAEQALDMGLVNTVVPLEDARGGDGRVVPRDARSTARSRCA